MPKTAGTWSPAQAAEMWERSRQARQKRAELKAAQAALPSLCEPPLEPPASYPDRLKARVRLQVELVCSQLDKEATKAHCDGAKLDRLASALERLAELERVLDGRPGPGNRRPPREDPPTVRPLETPRPAALPSPAPPPSPGGPSQTQTPTTPPRLSEPPDFE